MKWWGSKHGKRSTKQGDLTISDQVLKNEHLSSDFILSVMEDGVVMVGKDKTIHLFNPAASHITGWSAGQALGLDFGSVLPLVDEHGQAYPPQGHPIAKSLRDNSSVRDNKAWLVTRSGRRIAISLIVSPIRDETGKTSTGIVGVFRDVTKEKEEEAQRSDFISTASHEMRTPIAAIEGYLALALNNKICKIDENARKYLVKADTSTQHLGALFQDLLTSSKAEDGRLTSYPAATEIGEALEQVVDGARFGAKQKGLELHFIVSNNSDVSGEKVLRPLYYAFVDPNRIREVFQNLVDNAIKYTMTGGINVKLTGDNLVIQIQVGDTGPGIAPEDIPHLFQKFYRVDNSMTRTVGGTGLGLFICKRIVEMSSGRIWAESELDKGTTFFVNLPRLTAEQALKAQREKSQLISPIA
jgi:PAS domain S-box-containing protein